MANNSSYKVLLEAQIDPSKINQQIKVIQAQNTLLLNVKFNQGDLSVLNAQLDKLKQAGAELSKVTIFGDSSGGIRKAAVEYLDTNKNIVKTTMDINTGIKITQSTMQNLTQYAKEFSTSLLNAEKFLEKSKNMAATPQVQAAVTTANAIKEAVSAGDIAKVRQLNDQLAVQKSALTANKSALDSWIGGMKNAIKQTVEYAISVGLIYGALRQLKEGIQFVADLNKEMIKIQVLQVEGAKTDEQIGSLALSFNSLARELGSTTQEVARGSVEWLRQGKSIEQTQELLRSTMMLSKLGALESAQATEYLTAILNGFQMEAKEAESVVSKLVSIDNIAATSAGEMATALQYSSAVANQTGVSFDRLAAIIATVSSRTRLSAEMIGQALRYYICQVKTLYMSLVKFEALWYNK